MICVGKVKLTQEQADAIESTIGFYNDIERIIELHVNAKDSWIKKSEALKELSLFELVNALCIGYEVKPDFEVGDWVVAESGHWKGSIGELKNHFIFLGKSRYDFLTGSIEEESIRHATPEEIATEKERRWWAKHDRGVWELREGDILVAFDGGYLVQIDKVFDAYHVLFLGGAKEVELKEVKNNFELVCFAEDRKDA